MVRKLKKNNNEDTSGSMRLGEFGSAIMQIAEEKGISKDKVVETIEAALAAAYKKEYGKKGQHIRAEFNEVNGSAKFFKVLEVVDESVKEFPVESEDKEDVDGIETLKAEGKNKKPEEVEPFDEDKLPRFNQERDIVVEEAKKLKKGVKLGDVIEIPLESKTEYGRIAAQTAKQVIIQKLGKQNAIQCLKNIRKRRGSGERKRSEN